MNLEVSLIEFLLVDGGLFLGFLETLFEDLSLEPFSSSALLESISGETQVKSGAFSLALFWMNDWFEPSEVILIELVDWTGECLLTGLELDAVLILLVDGPFLNESLSDTDMFVTVRNWKSLFLQDSDLFTKFTSDDFFDKLPLVDRSKSLDGRSFLFRLDPV